MIRHEPIVRLAVFTTEFEASLARGALEAIGIRVAIPTEKYGTFARYRPGMATVELQVFESDRERALIELRRLQMRIVEPPQAD